jgi:glycosyltransferase involved in cell wall biosynthesis
MQNETSEKLKVAIVATSMRVIGGQSIQANRLLDAFANNENIGLSFIPNNPETIFQNVKILRTIFTSLKFWWLLIVNLPKVDIVQVFSSATTGYIISTLPPLFFAKLFRKKIILNYHSGELEEHIKRWKHTALPTMRKFDKIIVPSQFLVDVFAKYGLESEAIFNFVDSSKFEFKKREIFRPAFFSNRNFEEHYNVSDILKAFQIIQRKFPNASLIIAGFGTEEAKLKEFAKTLNLANVDFIGKIDNEKMPEVYQKADIYLNASVVDNMPLSFIEAFACGLPTVSYATGGIPYIVENGKSGILVEQNDFENLANEAIKLLENQQFAIELTLNARKELEKYSWENVKEAWEIAYRNQGKSKK